MQLSKSEVKALVAVLEGKSDILGLQEALKVAQPRASYLAEKLVNKGFLIKERNGLKIVFRLASTPYAIKFREMYIEMPQRRYPEILSGRNLDVLQVIVYAPKETKTIAKILGIQPRAIRERLTRLMDFALIYKTGKKYVLSSSAKEIYSFIDSIRRYMDLKGILYWRLNDNILYATRDEKEVQGHLTGFNEYGRYGVQVNTIFGMCFTGKKPSMEEIFIHSLFQVEDSRTLGLAITFYAKNRLDKSVKTLKFLADKYDLPDKFDALIDVFGRYKKGEERIEVKGLPSIEKETIDRMFELYGVSFY